MDCLLGSNGAPSIVAFNLGMQHGVKDFKRKLEILNAISTANHPRALTLPRQKQPQIRHRLHASGYHGRGFRSVAGTDTMPA
jgi:hypothetical protein